MSDKQDAWDAQSLGELFLKNGFQVEVEQGVLIVTDEDRGAICRVSIRTGDTVMDTPITPVSSVKSEAEVNAVMMRENPDIDLSNVCIKQFGSEEWFMLDGQLSSNSKDTVMLEELDTLCDNVLELKVIFKQKFVG